MISLLEADIDHGIRVTAKEADNTVGFGMATLQGPVLFLDSIHVIPPFRGKGLGTAIIDACIKWGQQQGAQFLKGEFKPEFGNETLVRPFYEKKGIEITPEGKLFKKL